MLEHLDRSEQKQLLAHCDEALAENRTSEAVISLSEAAKLAPLPQARNEQLTQLQTQLKDDSQFQRYCHRTGILQSHKRTTRHPLRILVVTNLFPPQEFGGYGRTIWEFCSELRKRGHTIQVLTSNVPDLSTPPAPDLEHFEHLVSRSLYPLGDWTVLPPRFNPNHQERIQLAATNHERVIQTVHRFKPDVCLTGNLDLIDFSWIESVLKMRIPCVYRLGNAIPSFGKTWTPHTPLFTIAPCSQWLLDHLETTGYSSAMPHVLYPGAMVEHYYLHHPPVYDKLRIVFASHISEVKGADVLVKALVLLHQNGIPFEADLAGHFSDKQLADNLRSAINSYGVQSKVRLHGYVDSDGLKRLYAKANTLVFPSSFDEPFGKTAVEGMAAGLLLVSSGTGGQPEIFEDGVSGLKFERMSHESLATVLASLPKDRERWKQIAQTGHERAFEFTTATSVDTLEHIFEEQLTHIPAISSHDTYYYSPKRQNILKQLLQVLETEQTGEKDRARIQLEECFQQDNELPETLYCRGAFHARHNQWQSANINFLNALMLTPNLWQAHYGHAKCQAAQNNWGPAARAFSEAAQWATQEPVIFQQLAQCMEQLKHPIQQKAAEHRAQALAASGIPVKDPLSLEYSKQWLEHVLSPVSS